ncbi:hypothetical protein ACQ4PT_058897 [Festuca glaucescens]
MHYSYCGRPDHNRNGCYWFKNGLPAPDQPQVNNLEPEEGTDTTTGQAPEPELGTDNTPAYENTFVDNLTQERPFVSNMDPSPTPTSTFISAAQATLNQVQASSSTIRQGKLAQKLQAMQNEKDKAVEERKLAILEAKYQVEVKKAEAVAKKRFEMEKKKTEQAEARASIAVAKKEKRKYDAEINKLAKTETRRIIAEVKKSCADKKKLEAAELKKIQAAEKKRLAAQEKAAMRAASTEAQSSHNAKKVSIQHQRLTVRPLMASESTPFCVSGAGGPKGGAAAKPHGHVVLPGRVHDALIFAAGAAAAVLLLLGTASFLSPTPVPNLVALRSPAVSVSVSSAASHGLAPGRTFYDDPDLSYAVGRRHLTGWDAKRAQWLRLHYPRGLNASGGARRHGNKLDYCRLNGVELFYNTALLHPEMKA